MSESIELSNAEIEAAAADMSIPGGMGFENRRQVVAAVIRSVNKLRSSDPVGTIRRSRIGNVSILTEEGWVWVEHSTGDTCGSSQPSSDSWKIIYSPDASGL
jgi:hypothetical protein